MAIDTCPSYEFGPRRSRIYALAGTAALPSPKPATGQVLLGITPRTDSSETLETVVPEYYLKSVQNVHNSLQITRIVSLLDVRAIGIATRNESTGQVESFLTKLVDEPEIVKTISSAQRELGVRNGGRELRLFDEAVLYVPETAPVFVRLIYEFGVTAAVAAENVECVIPMVGGACC